MARPLLPLLLLLVSHVLGQECKAKIVESTSYDCPSGGSCGTFNASNIFSLEDDKYHQLGPTRWHNYWLAADQQATGQGFALDLGCPQNLTAIRLKNTQNSKTAKDRSTKKFRVWGAELEQGPWSLLLEASLEDSRNQTTIPVQTLELDQPHEHIRYVKFDLLEFWGRGGGLQYFAAMVSGSFRLAYKPMLMKDTLVTTLATLAKEWRVTLEFWPTEYITNSTDNPYGLTNLLHLRNTKLAKHGVKTPAIHYEVARGLNIASSVNENHNYYNDIKAPTIGKWTRIEVGQREEDGNFTFYISIGGKEVHSVRNNQPREFHGVKVFASNPENTAQAGSIRDLTVETKVEGEEVLGRWCLHHLMQKGVPSLKPSE